MAITSKGILMIPQDDKEAMTLILEGITKAGCEVTTVEDDTWNPDDLTDVTSVKEAVELIDAVDEGYVYLSLPSGERSWIRFVLGNEPIEVACDHHVNLTPFIDPIVQPWWS